LSREIKARSREMIQEVIEGIKRVK